MPRTFLDACWDRLPAVVGKTFPESIPGTCAPAILRIWQEAHGIHFAWRKWLLTVASSSIFTFVDSKQKQWETSFHFHQMGKFPHNKWRKSTINIKNSQQIIVPCNIQQRFISNLTHWGWDKMAAIYQTTFSIVFFLMKMFEFWLIFHWNLFLRVQLAIFQHWFKQWFGADQATSHYLNHWWSLYWRIYASLGLYELKQEQTEQLTSKNSCLVNFKGFISA